MNKDVRCPWFSKISFVDSIENANVFSKGYCKKGAKCGWYHPGKVCTHVESRYCQICDPYSIYDSMCDKFLKGICNFGSNCNYFHSRIDNKISRPRQKYGDIISLPPDILKIILNDCYFSDLILVCKWFQQFIDQYYPLRLFIFKDIYPELSTGISIARKRNDAIFQLCLRPFSPKTVEPKCKGLLTVINAKDIKIDDTGDINNLEWENEEFYLYRKKLVKNVYYKKKEYRIIPEIGSANLFLRLNDIEPLILPLHQCTSFYY